MGVQGATLRLSGAAGHSLAASGIRIKKIRGQRWTRAIALISSSTAVSLVLLSNRRALTRLPSKQGKGRGGGVAHDEYVNTHELKGGHLDEETTTTAIRAATSIDNQNRSCLSKRQIQWPVGGQLIDGDGQNPRNESNAAFSPSIQLTVAVTGLEYS
ncbi:hypothetical protein TESG_08359 [Trichophyton tonsurans CBS 112818]|uniref:Uncharacterized protein n=1 Tax=Trichophyton tonsurans (strain CBS 112818) TaxID=647933 RepID=F2RUC4_TRIT1|nr:hypothetical protein TESG_08359 [Trichophyton tonsurans CBS 112818]